MKKFYVLLLLSLPLIANSQNVGIGITTPSAKLEVKEAIKSTMKISSNGYGDSSQLILSNRTVSNLGTDFLFTSAAEQGLYVTTTSDLSGNINDSLFSLMINGNIGMGVKTPQHRFHVHNAGSITTNINLTNFITTAANGDGLLLGINGVNSYLMNSETGTLQLGVGNLPRMTILANGNVELTGELNRTSTGAANMLPIAWGNVSSTGFIQTGSGNFTVNNISAGFYEIFITGEAYQFQLYATLVTPIGTSTPYVACTGSGGGALQVQIYALTGIETNQNFHFVVYKQ